MDLKEFKKIIDKAYKDGARIVEFHYYDEGKDIDMVPHAILQLNVLPHVIVTFKKMKYVGENKNG